MLPMIPPAQIQAPSSSAIPAGLPGVAFHSGFWMNLHHVLFEQARRKLVAGGARLWGPPPVPLGMDAGTLSPEARIVWERAVTFYAATYASSDLLFDADLDRVKAILAAHEDDAALKDPDLPPGLEAALNEAAPLYRATAWHAQDAANRRWLRQELPELERLWPSLRPELARAFQSPWPSGPARVDLCTVANWAGAYTTEGPLHIVLGTEDPRDQTDQGLEIVFHEISHGSSQRLEADLAREAEAQGRRIPGDLWHAMLFYTVGWTMRRALPGHQPYMEVQRLFDHAWSGCREPIEQAWTPWLEGKAGYAEALRALVARFPAKDSAAGVHAESAR